MGGKINSYCQTNKDVFARIPNLKIRECFISNIQNRFNTEIVTCSVADTLANTLFEGKADSASDTIVDFYRTILQLETVLQKLLMRTTITVF